MRKPAVSRLLLVLALSACTRNGGGDGAPPEEVSATAVDVSGMATFDRSYIPALATTSQQNLEASRDAMDRLQAAWVTLRDTYSAQLAASPAWVETFDTIGAHIEQAQVVVDGGTDLVEAHEALERVRVVFMELREREGIEYFIDHLTRFHEPMENIVLAVKDHRPEDLGDEQLAYLAQQLESADRFWTDVQAAALQAGLFGFDEARLEGARRLISSEREALDAFALRLAAAETDGGARAPLIPAGVATKPPFAQLFMLFGDFEDRPQ